MLSVLLAAVLRFRHDPVGLEVFSQGMALRAVLVALCITGAMAAFGLYQVHLRHRWTDLALRLMLSFGFGGIGLLVLYYVLPFTYMGRGVLLMSLATGFAALLLFRVLLFHVLATDVFRRRVLVFGAGENADLINQRMRRRSDRQSFVVVGFVPIPGQALHVDSSLLASGEDGLAGLVERLQVDEIVVAPDERRGALPMDAMLACAQRGVAVTDLSTFFEREAGLVTLKIADPSWLVFSGGFDHSLPRRLSKRCFDLAAALLLLAIAWPAMLAVAVCIWFEDGRPLFYRQTRVGEGGRNFDLIKFRSMRTDAEADGVARWAKAGDDRTTRIGRFIRLTRLDELPQLFNIIRGEMSFVGPRPERPQFVDMLDQQLRYYSIRHSVKPGLTGWAQLRYPYGASVQDAEEKLKFDLFYVKNQRLLFDMMILLQTVEVVVFQRGSR
ncbi:TIGR03013 family PEP-CTERM/XrtA system glycosyltransferase [Lysobacter alkalisoli]|uniref:TIGR03013 family PEP-CTERM/XrtA system glycosyltransferase n=2 Tax=Marilutibacter alkalisoli TaxID=2591633 RepID=A0A514BWJ0_9GAMM|nr:TIGR03013 family PEP-CTERM/XrtA system glycosyltransferase [Lysobacter alkalisoli]